MTAARNARAWPRRTRAAAPVLVAALVLAACDTASPEAPPVGAADTVSAAGNDDGNDDGIDDAIASDVADEASADDEASGERGRSVEATSPPSAPVGSAPVADTAAPAAPSGAQPADATTTPVRGSHRSGTSPDCTTTDAGPGAWFVFPNDDAASQRAGRSPVTVEFLGCSDTFEATVVYEAYHGQDRQPTLSGHTMGGTLGEWGPFRFEETFWTPGTWTVVVLEFDAEDGRRRVHDRVTFTVDPR